MLTTSRPDGFDAQSGLPEEPPGRVSDPTPTVVFDESPQLRPPLPTVLGAILLCIVTVGLGAQGAVIAEFLKTPEWEAVTEVEFRDPAVLNETVAVTLESPAMWNPIAEREGITDKEFQKHYDAAVTGGTQIIRVRFIDEDPERATRIVNDIVNSYVEQFSTPDTSLADSVVEERLSDLRSLEESLSATLENRELISTARQIDLQDQLVRVQRQINEAAILLAGREAEENRRRLTDPRVVTPGFILEEPTTPNPLQALVFGGVAGGLIGVVGVYLAFHRAVTVPISGPSARTGGPFGSASSTRTIARTLGGGHADRSVAFGDSPTGRDRQGRPVEPFATGVDYRTRVGMRGPLGSALQRSVKRSIDILVSLTMLIVLSPLLAVVALLVRFTSPGPAIFRQSRIGQYGQPFRIYKFRTMVTNADDSQHVANVMRQLTGDAAVTTGETFKHTDPRVTGVGRWLRRLSIDELPQLWNVLKGDMSLVGPRPALDWEHSMFGDQYQVRTIAPPGCTGLWQVSGRSTLSVPEMLEFDLEYIDNWSLRRDLGILLSTPLVMLRGDGAR